MRESSDRGTNYQWVQEECAQISREVEFRRSKRGESRPTPSPIGGKIYDKEGEEKGSYAYQKAWEKQIPVGGHMAISKY